MSNLAQPGILQQLEDLRREAEASLAGARTTEETRAWHSEYLGRKGRLTAILRNVGSAAPEERPLIGKLANEVKTQLESTLEQRQVAIEQAELEAARSKEQIDVTLPGRPQTLGKLHPSTRTLRDLQH